MVDTCMLACSTGQFSVKMMSGNKLSATPAKDERHRAIEWRKYQVR